MSRSPGAQAAVESEHAFRWQMDSQLPWRLRVAALTTFATNGAFVLIDALTLEGDVLSLRTAVRVLFAPLFLLMGALASGPLGRRAPQTLVIALGAVQALQLALTGLWLPPRTASGSSRRSSSTARSCRCRSRAPR